MIKKALIRLPAILLIVFIFFSLIDFSEYATEKKIWKIQLQERQLAMDTKAVPVKQLEELVRRCRVMVKKHSSSIFLPQMYMQLAQAYELSKDYDQAKANYNIVIKKFPQLHEMGAYALMKIKSEP